MSVIPCQSCAPVDCLGQGSTISPATQYSLSGPAYGFVFNCPPGVDCNNAPFLLLMCCNEIVFVDLLGLNQTQRRQRVTTALNRCAGLWSFCGQCVDCGGGSGGGGSGGGGGGGGGSGNPPVINVFYANAACCPVECNGILQYYCLPAGTVLSPVSFAAAQLLASQVACSRAAGGRVNVGNTLQCYTASCGGGDPFTATRCTEANTYGTCLFFPTPQQLQIEQQTFDDIALGFATADANQAIVAHGCLVCNQDLTGFVSCPGDPTKTVHIDIPAGTFCGSAGSDPNVVMMQAQDSLNQQLHNGLVGLGCACPSPVSASGPGMTRTVTFTCATFLQYSWKAFGGIIAFGPGVYDATLVATALNGAPPPFPGNPPFTIHPIGWVGPDIVFYWG